MRLIWLTGVPGAGKSTVRRELVRRGEIAHDADEDGFRVSLDRATGSQLTILVAVVVRQPGTNATGTPSHETG